MEETSPRVRRGKECKSFWHYDKKRPEPRSLRSQLLWVKRGFVCLEAAIRGAEPVDCTDSYRYELCKHAVGSVRACAVLPLLTVRRNTCEDDGWGEYFGARRGFFAKSYTNLYLVHSDTHRTRALESKFVRGRSICEVAQLENIICSSEEPLSSLCSSSRVLKKL